MSYQDELPERVTQGEIAKRNEKYWRQEGGQTYQNQTPLPSGPTRGLPAEDNAREGGDDVPYGPSSAEGEE